MTLLSIALGLAFIGLFCCLLRAIIGPRLPDRVIALDLAANTCLCMVAIVAVMKLEAIYMDVVIALALIIFLSTVAFAQLLEWRDYRKGQGHDK